MYLAFSNLVPVAFHGYTSIVLDHVLEGSSHDGVTVLVYEDQCLAMFKDAGIPAYADNKIVFEFKTKYGQKPFFIGFYDGRMSIGNCCRTKDNIVLGLA